MTALLRLENLALGLLALLAYYIHGGSWILFAVLILAPDVSFLGYLANPKVGAIFYNILHSWIGPVVALSVGWMLQLPLLISIGLIWGAHIGFDRAMGYGLKHYSGFKDTHLGRIGGGMKS